MKTFKIKDLVVSLAGQGGGCGCTDLSPVPTGGCDGATFCIDPSGVFCEGVSDFCGQTNACLTPTQFCAETPLCSPFTHCHLACSQFVTPINCCKVRSVMPSWDIPPVLDCKFTRIPCKGTHLPCGQSISPWVVNGNPHEIEVLKKQLTELQKAMESKFKPQNIEDLDMLENKLNEALKEVKDQKKNLK